MPILSLGLDLGLCLFLYFILGLSLGLGLGIFLKLFLGLGLGLDFFLGLFALIYFAKSKKAQDTHMNENEDNVFIKKAEGILQAWSDEHDIYFGSDDYMDLKIRISEELAQSSLDAVHDSHIYKEACDYLT